MATRMQQRRGTAAQWISTDSGSGPILAAGEIGYESDTNKFKIGDGVNHWLALDYFMDADSTVNPQFGSSIKFEGAVSNAFETTLEVAEPTADRTLTLPNTSGTIAITTDISDAITNAALTTSDDLPEGTNNLYYTTARKDLKANLASPTFTGTVTLPSGTVTSTMILDGTIATADIADSAITSAKIADGTIVDADINASAAIAQSKISGLTSDLAAKAPLASPTFTGTVNAAALTLSGDLTVNGTTTTINSTTLAVDDKNIVLGDVATPSDVTADGGGITLKGATDKTFNWVDATDAWTSSEHVNLASGKTLKYNGTDLVASQSGNSGKYLTTDGTSTSWGTVSGYSAPTLGSTSIASGATVSTIAGLTLTSPALTTPTISTYTTAGDLLYGSGSGVLTRLGIGSSTQVLTVVGGVPAWAAGGSAADNDQPILASQIFG